MRQPVFPACTVVRMALLGMFLARCLATGWSAQAAPPPGERFHRAPDDLPWVRLVPQRPLESTNVDHRAIERFERWTKGETAGDGLTLARERRAAMARLIETDPAEALRRRIPDATRAKLHPSIAAEVEETVRGVGSLLVVCALPADPLHAAEIQREVIVNGKHYRAFTHGHRLEQECAKETPIFGIAIGDVLALEDQPYRRLDPAEAQREFGHAAKPVTDAQTGQPLKAAELFGAIDEGDQIAFFGSDTSLTSYVEANWTPYIAEFGGSSGGPGTTNTWTQGTRKFVAYRARLAEDATNYEPYAYASGITAFNTCSNWFYQWSYGSCTMQFVVVTNVYVFTNSGAWYEANGGWPKVLADCRTASLGTPEAYTNFNFDSVTHNWNVGLSGYAGVAYVGGRGASFHEGYGANDGVVGHEHGHNLGLPHNNFWDTAGQSIFGPGTHSEYGNPYDIMGDGYGDWPFAANSRNRLAWLPDMHAAYNTIGTNRVYAMDRFPLFLPDTNAPNAYALAVPRDGRNYIFEFRQDTNKIGSNASFVNGVLLEVDGGFSGGPELLDCTPGSSGGKNDAALTIGRMFSDPNVNIHVTPIARGPTSSSNWIDLVLYRNSQISNHPPALAITASSYTTAVGVAVTLSATASDPDGDDLAYYWEFGDGAVSYNNTNLQVKSWSTAGVYAVRCVAADMHGREANAQVLVSVGTATKFTISGRVLSPSGQPVPGVRIASSGPNVYSDLDGRYTIANLAAGSYTVTANGADTYGNNYTFTYNFANPVTVGPSQPDRDLVAATVVGTNIGNGTGFLYERWDAISGTALSALTNDPTYPNQPDDQRVLKSYFEAPTDRGDNYGTRLRAIYTAPLTGTYYFYIASDDLSELRFSTTTNPATATKIASVTNFTASREWTKYTSQKSAAISLTAGQKCYIEALHKEGTGGDNLAVGADLPDGSQERPIPFHRLDPWLAGFPVPAQSVGIVATDAAASESGPDTGTFTLTRFGDSADALTVTFQLSGDAQYGVDYAATGLTASFAAGETQAVFTITPVDDALSELTESVTATLIPGTLYAVETNAAATIAITDNEGTSVSVSAPDSVADETGGIGRFQIARLGSSTGSIVVALAITGTASNGVDFPALPASVTIPAGSSTVSLAVSPTADGLTEIAETVIVTALGGAGYTVSASSNATVTISADRGPGTGVLREWWTGIAGSLVTDLTSNSNYPATPTGSTIETNLFEAPTDWADSYGTRMRGYFIPPVSGAYYFYIASDDYSELWLGTNATPASASKIASVSGFSTSREWTKFASQKSAAINLVTGQLYYIEALHKEGSGGDNLAVGVEFPGGYLERPIPAHRLFPYDTQKPTISIFAADASASEAGDTGSVLLVRSAEGAVAPFTVGLSYDGTAGNGIDFAAMPTQVTFAASVTNLWLALVPTNDTLAEGTESANISIVSDGARFFTSATASNAVVAIADDDIPVVSVAASPAYAYEAGPTGALLVISRSGSLVNPVAVNYTLAGSATPGSDFDPLPGYISSSGSVTLAAGQVSTNLLLLPVDDATAEGPESVTLQLLADQLYTLDAGSAATVTILDNDVAPVIALTSPTTPNIRIPPGVGLILDATITHNGLPNPPSAVTQSWTQLSGPTNATLTTSNDWKNAAATFPTIGTYVLQLTATAGALTTATSVTVNVGTFTNAGPQAWTNAGIGYYLPPTPTYSVTNGTNTIVVAGDSSINSGATYDDAFFVMTPVAGNCSITAQVTAVQNVSSGKSRIGVMMRESLDKSSKSAFMGLAAGSSTSTRGGKFVSRTTNGAANAQTSANNLNPPYWVRLDRTGNVFRAFRSSTGATWTQVGTDTTIAMSNTIYVGFAAASGLTNSAGTFRLAGLGLSSAATGVSNVGALVSAGAASSANLPGPATLSGSASDDGLPNPPAALSYAWAKLGGSGNATFANPAATNTTVSLDAPGNYALRLIANDGQIKTFADTTVTATGFGVRILATDPLAATPGTNTATFVVTRDGPTNAALTVNLTIGGTAINGTDYALLGTQVVIAAGSSNATITVAPIDVYEPRDTVTVVIAVATSTAYAVEAQSSDTAFLANTNLPVITVVASDPNASEPPGAADPGLFTFTRAGGTNYPLSVAFDLAGSAISGVDFVPVSNTITFITGSSNASVTITPLDHTYGSAPLTVTASIATTAATYAAGTPASALVTITNKNFFALNLAWRGLTNNLWDLATTPNWFALDTAISNVVFSNNYSVVLDDAPGVLTNVTLADGVQVAPSRLDIQTDTNAFTLAGNGGLAGTGVIAKAGAQTFALGGSNNTFSGAVLISNGVLRVTTTNALGTSAGGTFVSGSGTLDLNGLNIGNERITISGAGYGGAGAIVNSASQQVNALQYVTLAGDASIGGLVRWDVRAGTSPFVNLNGRVLTKTGTNYVAFVSAAVTNGGDLLVNSGTLALSINTTVSGPGSVTINAGGTLAPGNFGGTPLLLKPTTLNGGTLQEDTGSGGVIVGAPITVNAGPFTNRMDTPDNVLTVTNTIGGAGGFTKSGANRLVLLGLVTNAGGISVTSGVVQLGNYNTASGDLLADINLAASAQLFEIRRPGPYTWSRNISGNGTIQLPATNGSFYVAGTNVADQLLIGSGATRGTNSGVVLQSGSSNVIRSIQVAYTGFGVGNYGRMEVQPGAYLRASDLFLGNSNPGFGDVIQYGGTVLVTNSGTSGLRIGHWPNTTTSNALYQMGGGTLAVTNNTIYVGWDGIGVLVQTGGTIVTRGLVVDASGATAATNGNDDTYSLTGGQLWLGTNGLTTVAGGSYLIQLGGGLVGAAGSWTSTLAMTLTGTNGPVTFDTLTNSIVLSGGLNGTGGLVKAGAGSLFVAGTNGFSGGVAISNGVLHVNGLLSTSGIAIAAGGILAGTGSVAGIVANDGAVSPGWTNIGSLTLSNSFTQSSGILNIQLATNLSDRLVISGGATLGGTLQVTAVTNFAPATGSVFTVLAAGSVNGSFAATNLPPLPAHRAWNVTYTTTSVVLSVAFTNNAPTLNLPGPHLLALGRSTNFAVTANDADGDATTVTNTLRPAGANFTNGLFTWTATTNFWNTTNSIIFVVTDALGLARTNATTIVVPCDFDGDGLPDNWEWTRFATLTNDASSDPTGKGNTLAEDYVAGTDPTNRNSTFRAIAIGGSPATITAPTISGRLYRVWFADDALAANAVWQLFNNQANGVGSWLETNAVPTNHLFTDDFGPATSGQAPTNGLRLYRIDVKMAP